MLVCLHLIFLRKILALKTALFFDETVVANYEMKYIDSFKATQTGLYLVIISALTFMLFGILTSIYFIKEFNFHPLLSMLIFIPVSLIIYTPFWSFILAKWKIWSYEKIDDVEIFIKLAERKNLIYPDNHFYTKYELCSKKDKNLIRELKATKLAGDNANILISLYRNKEFKIKSYFDLIVSKGVKVVLIVDACHAGNIIDANSNILSISFILATFK